MSIVRDVIAVLRGTTPGPVPPGEVRLWAEARSLLDLCYLTNRWLIGELGGLPTYWGICDVDDAPGMRMTLIVLNRLGFLTVGSQEGFSGTVDGHDVQQLAAVEGFATPAVCDMIRAALAGTDYQMVASPARAHWWNRQEHRIPATWYDGAPVTQFGYNEAGGEIAAQYDICHPTTIAALRDAQQVLIYDSAAGRNGMWAVLGGLGDQR